MSTYKPHFPPIITIDGPSGVGKGTISKMLAAHLDWHFLDSGLLYRLTAYASQKAGVLPTDAKVSELARVLPVRFVGDAVFFEEENVTDLIRREEMGNLASKVAASLPVREALEALQRSFAKAPGLVADGRDMGTEIFPEAKYKFFLTASVQERARRRFKQLQAAGIHVNMADILREIEERDERDRTRTVRPLRPAKEAVVIDTSNLTVEDVFTTVWAGLGNEITA